MDQNPSQHYDQPKKDRRKIERFNLHLQAKVEPLPTHTDNSPMILHMVTGDISSQGAFFKTKDSLGQGTRIKVDLVHAPQGPNISGIKQALIHVTGTVLRRGPAGMAVVFDKGYRFSPLAYG